MSKTETTNPKLTVALAETVRSSASKSSRAPTQPRAPSKLGASAPRVKGEPASQTLRRTSKLSNLIGMLRDKRGASIDQLMAATGWQKHSVRGAISGAIKKRLGINIVSEQTSAGRIYRIVK